MSANSPGNVSAIIFLALCLMALNIFIQKIKSQNKEDESVKEISLCRDEKKILIDIISWTLISRILIFVLGYMSTMLFFNENRNFLDTFETLWTKWDAHHYLYLAEHWYQAEGDPRKLMVFYPLYPIVIKFLTFFIGDYFWSAMIISNVCLVVSAVYLYKLCRFDFDHEVSMNSVKYLLIYPFSFFLGLAFSEGLYLTLTILFFYYLRKKKWLFIGLLGALSTACRSFGILLIVPAIIEWVFSNNLLCALKNKNLKPIKLIKELTCIFLIPVGFIYYLGLNKVITGDYFKYSVYIKHYWGREFTFFGNVIDYIYETAINIISSDSISRWIPELIIIFGLLAIISYSKNKIPFPYLIYMLGYWFLLTSVSNLWSAGRYSTDIFPLYIAFALLSKNKNWDFILTSTCLVMLAFYTMALVYGKLVV